MSSQYNLKIGKTVSVNSEFLKDFTTDNVVISGINLEKLPSLAKTYLIQDLFKSTGLNNIAKMVDLNDPVIKTCPKILVEFIKEFIAVLRSFAIPNIHKQELQFSRSLAFCLTCPKLMKKSDQGCQFLIPFATVRAFYKNEKTIKIMFDDIIQCAFGFTSTKTYPVKIMFGVGLSDLSELYRACYEASGAPLPTK